MKHKGHNNNFNKNRHQPRPARQPLTPVRPENGLESRLNYNWTLTILRHSDRQQISTVLHEAGYRGAIDTSRLDAAVDEDVRRYLQTEDGKRRRQELMDRLLRHQADKELATEAGRRRLQELKAMLAASELAGDVDMFARYCQEELRRRVTTWIESPAGQEAVELAKQRMADREVRRPQFAQKPIREGT